MVVTLILFVICILYLSFIIKMLINKQWKAAGFYIALVVLWLVITIFVQSFLFWGSHQYANSVGYIVLFTWVVLTISLLIFFIKNKKYAIK